MDLSPTTTRSESPDSAGNINSEADSFKDKIPPHVSSRNVKRTNRALRWRTQKLPKRQPRKDQAPEQMPTPRCEGLVDNNAEQLDDLKALAESPGSIHSDAITSVNPVRTEMRGDLPRQDGETTTSTSRIRHLSNIAHQASPVTALQKGNSDPFSAFSVSVTATVTNLINFGRDVLHPALYASARQYNPTVLKQTLQDLWADVSSHLEDRVAAYAYLARSAVLIRDLNPASSPAGQELVFKHYSSKLLRDRLAQMNQDALHCHQTYFIIYALFQVELFDRNFESAAIHMKMLSTLITEHETGKYKKLPLPFVYRPLYTDAALAAMALIRPHFDPDGPAWIRFDQVKTDLLKKLPDIDPLAVTLEAAVSDKDLRAIFIEIRTLAAVRSTVLSDPKHIVLSSWLYAFSQASRCTSRLMKCYFDQKDSIGLEDSDRRRWKALQQAHMSLAAVLWLRQLMGVENQAIGSSGRMFAAYHALLPGMREALTQSKAVGFQAQMPTDIRARLWTLYIGAQFEEGQNLESTEARKGWFQREFSLLAKHLGLRTWPQTKYLLQGFLYADELRPHGSCWIWRVLSDDEENVDMRSGKCLATSDLDCATFAQPQYRNL